MINDTLVAFLDSYVTVYLDDILIYSDTMDEYWVDVRRVLEVFSGAALHLKPEMCKFHSEEMKYMRLIIRRGAVKMHTDKVTAVQDWLMP